MITQFSELTSLVDCMLFRLKYPSKAPKAREAVSTPASRIASYINGCAAHMKQNGVAILMIEDEREEKDMEAQSPLLFFDGAIAFNLQQMGWAMKARSTWASEVYAEAGCVTSVYFMQPPKATEMFLERGFLEHFPGKALIDLYADCVQFVCPPGGTVLEMYPHDNWVEKALKKLGNDDVTYLALHRQNNKK